MHRIIQICIYIYAQDYIYSRQLCTGLYIYIYICTGLYIYIDIYIYMHWGDGPL